MKEAEKAINFVSKQAPATKNILHAPPKYNLAPTLRITGLNGTKLHLKSRYETASKITVRNCV